MKGLCSWDNGSNIIEKVKDNIIDELLENPEREITDIVENTLGEISKGDSYQIVRDGSALMALAQNLVSELIAEGYLMEEGVKQNWTTQLATILQTPTQTIEETNEASDEKLLNGTYDEEDSDFMKEAYLGSAEAQQLAIQQGKRHIVTSFIYRYKNGAKSIISSQLDLNESIRDKQQELLEIICDYLKDTIKNNPTGIERVAEQYHVNAETVFNHILNPHIYREGKQSDFDYIKQRFENYFKRPANLNDLINNFNSPNQDSLRLKYLKAYNAYVLLDNFDAFIKEQLGKVININEEVGRFAPNRYSITQEGTNVYSTWRTSDEIWLDKEVNNIAQLIITTLPMWKNGSNVPQEGRYMKFNQFNYIIGKIKSGLFGQSGEGLDIIKERLSINSQNYLTNNKLTNMQELLLFSRTNPQKAWSIIFDVLAHSSNADINTLFGIPAGSPSQFTQEDSDIIYTLYKEIFENETGSLANSIDSKVATSAYNYLSNLSQVIDSIFRAKYIQYYTDESTGDIRIRALGDQTLTRIRGALERKINNIFSSVNYDVFKQTYPSINIETNSNGNLVSASFKIIGEGKTLIVKFQNGNFKIENEDGTNANFQDLGNASQIVKEAIGIDLDSPEYQNAFSNIVNQTVENSQAILRSFGQTYINLTLKSILRTILNNELLRGADGKLLTRSEVDRKLGQLFGEKNKPTINLASAGMNIIDSSDVPKIKQLARIEAQRLGLSTSAQVKDGNSNSVSNFTLSRLGDSYPHQWYLQNRLKESATKHFSILTSPAFGGLFQAKEFKDKDNNHPSEDMNESEMITASFINDFLAQLGNTEDGGMMYIIPAVISDKKFIGRLGIKLKELFDEHSENEDGTPMTWEDVLESSEYKDLLENAIRDEFYTYFTNAEQAINEDFGKIQRELLFKHASENEYFYRIFDEICMNESKFRLTRRGVERFTQIFEEAKARYNMSKASVVDEFGELPFINYSAADFLYKLTRDYNIEHPNKPIVLIDQVHFINNKGNLISNPTLTNSIDRFSTKESTEAFFKERNLTSASALLEKGFRYRISEKEANGQFSVNNLIIKNIGKDWLDNRGALILAKVTDNNGEVKNITSQTDVQALGSKTLKDLVSKSKGYEINPRLEQWNYMDYFWSEQFIISTVGHHFAHPNKAIGKWLSGGALTPALLINDEAIRKEMQNKRNVSITATMHEFILGDLMGIPSDYNIANIDDIKDTLYNITGNIDGSVKPYDGATFVNPFIVLLENYSLGGSKAGIVKKQFVHAYDHRTGTGVIIKTAGFGITNMTINSAIMDEAVMKSMTDRPWRASQDISVNGTTYYITDQLISETDANILVDFNGDTIDYGYFYYKEGDKYYQEKIDSYNGNYTYSGQRIECDPNNGSPKEGAQWEPTLHTGVNSNYKVWKMFGGKNSRELRNGKLVLSEESIKLTTHAINNVGIALNSGEKTTQDDVYQFMKHSDVHYLVTAGAIKQGAGNMNPSNLYTSGGQLNTMRIHMLQAGIQLDKEHSADGEEVSLMTQVISACIARGYTFDKSSELYQALAAIAENGLKEEMNALADMFQQNTPEARRNFQELVIDSLVKSIAEDANPNRLAETVAYHLISAMRNGVELSQDQKLSILPYSDPGFYNQMISKLSVGITKTAIKLKVDGVLSMLCPSHQRMMLWGGKMRYEWTDESLQAAQLEYDANPVVTEQNILDNDWSNLALGRTYKVIMNDGTYNVVKIITPLDYYKLKNTKNIKYVVEDITAGRDLAHYNVKFRAFVPNIRKSKNFQIWDLASVARLYRAEQEGQPKEIIDQLKAALQQDLNHLEQGYGNVDIIGQGTVNITEIQEVIPYEVILPAYFATEFGLDQFDDLSTINEEYFIRKQQEHQSPKIPDENYDICIRRLNGKHIYIKRRSTSNEGLVEKKIQKTTRQGKVYRKDIKNKGEVLYEMASVNDKVYVYQDPSGQNYEVIETDDLDFYLNEFKGSLYAANENAVTHLLNSQTVAAKNYFQEYQKAKELGYQGDFRAFNTAMRSGGDEATNTWKYQTYVENAKVIYASFQKALRLVAARIPAQSMQSFMPMKIAGFDLSGKNTAYVSTAQIWLQGSDYDIDTATFTKFAIDKSGRFIHWSPLAVLYNFEMLSVSDNLPFPTGKTIDETIPQITDQEFIIQSPFNVNEDGILSMNESQLKQWVNLIRFVNTYGLGNVRVDYGDGPRVPNAQELTQFTKIINSHNTFLFKQDKNRQLSAIKNFMLTRMYQVIESPANQIQAQVPIDTATSIVKRESDNPDLKDARLAREAIPGDASVKITGIFKNQVGKKGVGICAVGLKSYFADFLHYTKVLNTSNDKEDLSRLLLGNGRVKINGQTYYGLANCYAAGLASITDEEAAEIAERFKAQPEEVSIQELKQLITHSPNPEIDAAIILSALLSQATDNAKEGSLGKLNAGTRTLGMYIYGIVIGMPFHDVADIMMSPAAVAINNLMDGNSFAGISSLSDMQFAFTIISEGPEDAIQNIIEKYRGKKFDDNKSVYAHERNIAKLLYRKDHGQKSIPPLHEVLKEFLNVHNQLGSAISELNKLLFDEESEKNPARKDLIEASLSYLFILQSLRVVKPDNTIDIDQRYYALQKLYKGAEEFRKLGQILHLNQGINTSIDEFQNYIETFESLVPSQLKYEDYLKFTGKDDSEENKRIFESIPHKLTIDSFIDYPDIWIKMCEQKKVTFNILDIVNSTPHFKQYLTAVRLLDSQLKSISVKYRITKDLGPVAMSSKALNITKTKDKISLYSRLSKMMDDYIQTEWLLSTNKTFRIQKGQKYFDLDGTLQTAKSDLDIPLGTYQGRASFKLWMDQTVIPNLKKGFDGVTDKRLDLLSNRFIQDLVINSFDKTPNHINMNAYTLPINMSPRTEEESVLFEFYKREFNTLSSNAIYNSGGQKTNIQDLFFLYNIVSFQNQVGEATLKRIFEDSSDRGLAKEFYSFESYFDENSNLQWTDIPQSYWKLWATPVGSTYQSKINQIFTQDKNDFGLVLMRRESEINEEGLTGRKIYVKDSYTSDQSHIGFNSEDLSKGIKLEQSFSSSKFGFNNKPAVLSNNHGYWYLNISSHTIKLDLKDPYVTKLDSKGKAIKDLDNTTINAVINNVLNPC